MIHLYHNPRCSKSREALKLLQDKQLDVHIIEYLKTPPSEQEVLHLQLALGIPLREMMRRKEDDYLRLHLDDITLEDKHLRQALCDYPHLLERPIAVQGDKAVIGRPPENVLSLLD